MANIDPQHEAQDRDEVAEGLYQLASTCLEAYRDIHTRQSLNWATLGEVVGTKAAGINASCARLTLLARLSGRLAPGAGVQDTEDVHTSVDSNGDPVTGAAMVRRFGPPPGDVDRTP